MTKREAMRQTHQENALLELGFTTAEAEGLRRISMTLQRWFEHECNGAIQRDGENGDGKPFWYNTDTGHKIGPAPDREAGAMKRLKAIIGARNGRIRTENDPRPVISDEDAAHARPTNVTSYIQGDPRGAALYILRPDDVPDGADVSAYYSRGICVY